MMTATLCLLATQAMTFTADRIAADGQTKALAATGHVVAAYAPYSLRGDYMTRAADGTMTFYDPCCATTCTNAPGCTHWSVTGEVEYRQDDHFLLRNMVLRFYEVPVFWLPYLYYSMNYRGSGFSWIPGYTGRWGAFLLTRCSYHLLGDPEEGSTTWWLSGATRFDLRYRMGVAFGEDLSWNLGDWGRGDFYAYYAWDRDPDDFHGELANHRSHAYHHANWQSPEDHDRYAFNLRHSVELTERDRLRVRGSYYSDSSFRNDFQRKTLFNWKSQWLGYDNSGVFWEHVENAVAVGAETSGRLNKFYAMTDRLPEIYLDVHPTPVFGLPINYETENRIGYLRRHPAEYENADPTSAYMYNPGRWADYDAFRFDTYHRLTAPFRTLDDVLSVVPRVGYRGTGWSEAGSDDFEGWSAADETGSNFRSILEGGITFSARGTGWLDEQWRHTVEPYFDILAQEAWYSHSSRRPYVFDNLDASMMWEDQFAGRARNLPYSYYGVTPGMRNYWERADERGVLHTVVDFDVYAALQFNETSLSGVASDHRLAEVGKPNYGRHGCMVAPGARMRWSPDADTSLMAAAEYDADDNRIATADFGLKRRFSSTFSYYAKYALRDYRIWDYSSRPYNPQTMREDIFNEAKFHYAEIGFEQQPLDWFAWGPYLRWDIRQNELDGVGTWFDYLTDCLGFRLLVEYQNSYTYIDGYERGDEWSVGFYIYLRAFGSDHNDVFVH